MQHRTISAVVSGVSLIEKSARCEHRPFTASAVSRVLRALSLVFSAAILVCNCPAQTSLPFQVMNSKHKKWPADEATKIYFAACDMAARAIRPEQPPHLHPKFILVLGAEDNETVRFGDISELRLKNWEPAKFAHAVLVMAVRDVLPNDQLTGMVHSVVLSSQASISVDDLKHER